MQGSFESHQRFLFRAVKEDVRLRKGSGLTSSRVLGTKAALPRASYGWATSMQLIPGKAPVCRTKHLCQIRFLFKKQRGHQKQ